jgi:Cu2+-exporting ATPase
MPAATATNPSTPLAVVDDPIEQGRFTRWVVGPGGEKLAESSLQLAGMHCAACSGIIEQALGQVTGVHSARVSAAAERATVCWDPAQTRASELITAVRRAGYDAVPDAAAPARAMRRQEHRQALWRLFVAGFCAMQIMMMATPSYVAGPGDLAPDLRQLLNWGSWLLALPVLLFSSGPFLRGAWRSLRTRRIGMDVPVALGVLITFVASTGATFDPGGIFGSEVYFDSMTMFVSFLLGSRYVELQARQHAAETLEAALARLPETAWRVGPDGTAEPISVQRLRPGDVVRVPVGQAFPADGVVTQGQSQADESLLTGESVPVDKGVGAEVVAGSVNLGAPVLARVVRVGGDTRFESIVSMMRSAMTQRPAAARLADRWAAPFLWVVLLLAAGAAAAWSVIDPSRAVWVAVAVLIVTCPCALSLAAPAAMVAATRGLARRGVLLQRLDALETLARASHYFLDKTGTLTEDRVQWRQTWRLASGRDLWADDDAALAMAAGLAVWSSHPLSKALADAVPAAAHSQGWTQINETPGQGLGACDPEGRRWRLGSAAWAGGGQHDMASLPCEGAGPAGARVWLSCDDQAVAAFAMDEVLRPGTQQALKDLQDDGVHLTLLTGDSSERAQALALRVGLDAVVAAATPQDKLAAVANAQQAGQRVVMVGDGVNDAPVLARADASLAMGQGALVSRSHADAVITSNRLADLVGARRTAKRTLRIVRQNFMWAGLYNLVCIPLALVGWLPPWAAGLGMACSSLLVVLNALRAAR